MGLNESQVKKILQTVINIVTKLPSRGLSVKLNLNLGHLTVNEEGDLVFQDLANVGNVEGTAIKTKAS